MIQVARPVGCIYRLAQTFGRENLFMDVDHIPAGVDFVEYLSSQVAACDAFLAVIGPNWLDAKDDDGRRRFDNPDDFVAIEIAAALARNIRVIPVLIDGARTPKADKLPDSIKPLVRRNAVEVRNANFGRDADSLITKVREACLLFQPGYRLRVQRQRPSHCRFQRGHSAQSQQRSRFLQPWKGKVESQAGERKC